MTFLCGITIRGDASASAAWFSSASGALSRRIGEKSEEILGNNNLGRRELAGLRKPG